MKIHRYSGKEERRILTGMVVDKTVLGRIASQWTPTGLFRSPWSNMVGGWCVAHYREYDDAPNKSLEGIYDGWAINYNDQEVADVIGRFLAGLSDEYAAKRKVSNSRYLIDLAAAHFDRVRLEQLATALQGDLDSGNIEQAHNRVETHGPVKLSGTMGVDVLTDKEAIREAFESKSEPLVRYPGALGKFFGDSLERDGFVAFMAPEKRGKTWWLLDVAWRAMRQGRRVAFFGVGDLSQNQMMQRFCIRMAQAPRYAGTVQYPRSIERGDREAIAVVEHDRMVFAEPLDWPAVWKVCERYTKRRGGLLRLSTHANSTINVSGIGSLLQTWEREDWVPDVIIIDYADILAPPAGVQEYRHQINTTWKQLRSLSQRLHCLVVTATQADAKSYTVHTLGRGNFSEDKRIHAHVTGMVGINSTNAEKEVGLMRLNWLQLREAEFVETRCTHVAGCLPLAQPAVISCR